MKKSGKKKITFNMNSKDKNQNLDTHPYKCKVCGMVDIKQSYDICQFCGWEDDRLQNEQPDYMGGANHMSLNQYKKFWQENEEEILTNLKSNKFYAIEKSQEYYKTNFKNHKSN